MNRSMPGLPVHHQLPEFTQIHVLRVSDAIQLSHPLLSPSSPAPIPPSIRVFSNKSTLHMRWLKYWSFSFSISPSNEHPGPISFRMDWLDLLAVQGTLKSLLQYYSSKASILRCSAFFTVQLSHPYLTTGKTIALTRRTFVGKVMSLLFNMLSQPGFKFRLRWLHKHFPSCRWWSTAMPSSVTLGPNANHDKVFSDIFRTRPYSTFSSPPKANCTSRTSVLITGDFYLNKRFLSLLPLPTPLP